MANTKIIATVGPACSEPAVLKQLLETGVDVFRINVSHTPVAKLKGWIDKIRQMGVESGHPDVSILVDLQGPRIRTSHFSSGTTLTLKTGERIQVETGIETASAGQIATRCEEMPIMLHMGDSILLDNGMMELKVEALHDSIIECVVVRGGVLGENKGINLPYAPATLPALTENDRAAAKVAVAENVRFIALSFVRNAADLKTLTDVIDECDGQAQIIAKIEKPSAIKNIMEIMAASRGIMVARGDLGVEIGIEKVPILQKQLIRAANANKVPVITATQMLESMMKESHATRAEASDISNAVLDGTDYVMLSGETAIGRYPVEAVRFMQSVIQEAEHYKADPFDIHI